MVQLKTPYIILHIWWCGDDECNCSQPLVELVIDNPSDNRCVKRTKLWEGTFTSDPDADEMDKLLNEMKQVALEFNFGEISPDVYNTDFVRPATDEEIRKYVLTRKDGK